MRLGFTITDSIRLTLGNNKLRGEILAAPSHRPTRPVIHQSNFSPKSKAAVVRGLRSNVVYNVRFFMMTGSNLDERRYFVNTFIKTGTSIYAPLFFYLLLMACCAK